MSKKVKRTIKKAPARRVPWLWALIAGGALVIAGGLAVLWPSTNAAPADFNPEATGAPRLAVDQAEIDEGYIKLNNTIRTDFRLKNVGDQPLQILGEPQVELVEGC
ncbi:MAG: hypothetical protein ACE5G8_12480 [Anaerolineae bacterium]